jgi:serine/threonine-protein kinase
MITATLSPQPDSLADVHALPLAPEADAASTDVDAERALLTEVLGAQYQVVRPLGRGGVGAVYLARDRALHRVVAIKVLRRELSADAADRERFRREARMMARLIHPSIVPVHAFGEVGELLYIVMQYVDGESLAERLRRQGKLTAREVRRVLGDLALALDYAHGQGVVHRDLKPDNILIDRTTGRAMLTDFGVATLPSYEPMPADAGLAFGTPHFMSPEQLGGRARHRRTQRPVRARRARLHDAERPPAVPRPQPQRALGTPPRAARPVARRGAPFAPATLVEAVERCLAKDPAQRWQRGRDLHRALTSRRLALKWPTWARPSVLRAAVI